MTDCPNTDQLLEIVSAEEDTATEVRAHLEHCQRCQSLISKFRGVLEVAGAYQAFEAGADEEMPADLAERIFNRVNSLYEEHVLSARSQAMRSLAVMFTDMEHSTSTPSPPAQELPSRSDRSITNCSCR